MRRFDDANLWSGVNRIPNIKHLLDGYPQPSAKRWRKTMERERGIPTLIVTLRLRYWSLPLSVSVGGHLLSKPGFTFGVGPIYFSWSIL